MGFILKKVLLFHTNIFLSMDLFILPFLFHVKVSLNFCPSISKSTLIGTKTSS